MVVLVGLVGLRIVIKVSLGLFKGVTFSIRLEIEHPLIFDRLFYYLDAYLKSIFELVNDGTAGT